MKVCGVILKLNPTYQPHFILTYELEPSLGIDQAVFRYNFSQYWSSTWIASSAVLQQPSLSLLSGL